MSWFVVGFQSRAVEADSIEELAHELGVPTHGLGEIVQPFIDAHRAVHSAVICEPCEPGQPSWLPGSAASGGGTDEL